MPAISASKNARARRETRWNSCETPTAATPDFPVAACAARCGCMTSIFRSSLPNFTHGIPVEDAYDSTAWRNRVPMCSISAGDGIGLHRCCVMNTTTCPLDCRTGTYAFR